jgi:hypothetical protein
MSSIFGRVVREPSTVKELSDAQPDKKANARTFSAANAAKLSAAAFPAVVTKVAVINVDTSGRKVLLSGQEGICVQWR